MNELLRNQNNIQQSISDIYSIPKGKKIFPVSWLTDNKLSVNQIWLYKIEEIAFDDDYPHREAFENVIQSMSEMPDYNLVYILDGNKQGLSLYLGIVWNKNITKNTARDNADNLISSFLGNFNGSKVSKVENEEEIHKIISAKYSNAGLINGIPSVNEDTKDLDFQGIDRLINSMLGLEWRLIIVCEPVSRDEVLKQQELVYQRYTELNFYKTSQFQLREEKSKKETEETSDAEINKQSTSHLENNRSDVHINDNNGGETHREEKNTSKGKENRKEFNQDNQHSEKTDNTSSKSQNLQTSHNFEIVNKRAQEILKYIDDEFLPRIKNGATEGMFKTSLYYMANTPKYAEKLQKNIISLFQGNKISYSPLQARQFTEEEISGLNILNTFQNYSAELDSANDSLLFLFGRPHDSSTIGLSTYLTTQEISIIAGLPQKEVPGIALKSAVSFGLNEETKKTDKEYIDIGSLVQKGRVLEAIPFYLPKDAFNKHIFIAGTTGSGKTTTCHTLIKQAEMPYLIIEPAKTEYRCLIGNKDSDVIVFTPGNEQVAPFRLNPFELIKGEVISGHVDMIKATFTSAFPMEASMPQILEEAIYKCYEKKGWNIYTNENDLYENPYSPDVNSFPIMSDLIVELSEVVNSKGFDARLKNDYIGSLVSRLSNLTIGSKGAMLNCFHSTNFEYIATHNVIMELEGLRSQEDKSLMMGFILTRLSSQIRMLHNEYADKNKVFRHLTFIEEAHRLLSKVEPGDSGAKKTAVETFSDLLAEVRKYGEGLVIIDQIPNKLSPEVLKNTNTKIIQKLFSQDDKDAVGNTMLMDDDQKKFISALPTGQAIIFTETTAKPVHVKITQLVKTDGIDPKDSKVKEHFENKKKEFANCYETAELMQIAQTDLSKLISELAAFSKNPDTREKIISIIHSISKKNHIEENKIWEHLLNLYDSICGKAMLSYEETNVRKKDMKEFFEIYQNDFEKITDDFLVDDSIESFSKKPIDFLGK